MASLPPDNRAQGTPDPASDVNALTDCVSVISGSAPGTTVTAQQTMDTIAAAVTNNQVLAGNGTHVTLRALAAADLPAATTSAQGAVQLDTATPAATSTAGSSGSGTLVMRSNHVHAQVFAGVFGDGSDGAVTCDGSTDLTSKGFGAPSSSIYTMTRDVFCTSLTINNTVTVNPAGWRIFCMGTLTNNGTISALGNAGLANGNNGAALTQNTLQRGQPGGGGATGAGSAGTNTNGAGLNTAGTGGTGTSGAGGAGGTAGASGNSWFRNPGAALAGITWVISAVGGISGGPGGGGGGCDGTNKGGGGGSGGGAVVIFAWAVNNGSGTITAAGGAGGTPTAGNTGGGGGGSGGLILAYTLSAWTAGTTSVAGGGAGSPHGTGTNNATAGGAGTVLNQVLM